MLFQQYVVVVQHPAVETCRLIPVMLTFAIGAGMLLFGLLLTLFLNDRKFASTGAGK